MKKQILALSLGLMTVAVVAQKKELRAAEKAIKKQDFAGALTKINSVEGTIANADAKYKSQYYFLKGKALAGKKDYQGAAKSFSDLRAFEKESGKKRYSDKAAPILNQMIGEVSQRGANSYNAKDYKSATKDFYTTFLLSPNDTAYLFNAAVSASIAKDYDSSLKYYNKLKDLGYTGIVKQFLATNTISGKVENLGSKSRRDLMIKTGQYSNPKDEVSESKKGEIVKNIAFVLKAQGKTDEAILAVQEARKSNPSDLNLLLTEADLYIKLKKMDKFGELMEQAVKMDPTNPTLFYNLGVVNYGQKRIDDAKKYYKKAIELNPEYTDAYMNLAISVLSKDKELVDKMNSLPPSDMKGYDKLELERKSVYKEALPYLEKADSLKRSAETVRTLLNIYETLEMEEKAAEYRALFKAFKK
ncbi:MAG: tetratricopeptide repeat protein [Flavobacteriaceae bacterium]